MTGKRGLTDQLEDAPYPSGVVGLHFMCQQEKSNAGRCFRRPLNSVAENESLFSREAAEAFTQKHDMKFLHALLIRTQNEYFSPN